MIVVIVLLSPIASNTLPSPTIKVPSPQKPPHSRTPVPERRPEKIPHSPGGVQKPSRNSPSSSSSPLINSDHFWNGLTRRSLARFFLASNRSFLSASHCARQFSQSAPRHVHIIRGKPRAASSLNGVCGATLCRPAAFFLPSNFPVLITAALR
jgi:hypothetical protein